MVEAGFEHEVNSPELSHSLPYSVTRSSHCSPIMEVFVLILCGTELNTFSLFTWHPHLPKTCTVGFPNMLLLVRVRKIREEF